jgi:hypothetical protein
MIQEVTKYKVLCELCDNYVPYEFDSEKEAIKYSEKCGWQTFGLENICDECIAEMKEEY